MPSYNYDYWGSTGSSSSSSSSSSTSRSPSGSSSSSSSTATTWTWGTDDNVFGGMFFIKSVNVVDKYKKDVIKPYGLVEFCKKHYKEGGE